MVTCWSQGLLSRHVFKIENSRCCYYLRRFSFPVCWNERCWPWWDGWNQTILRHIYKINGKRTSENKRFFAISTVQDKRKKWRLNSRSFAISTKQEHSTDWDQKYPFCQICTKTHSGLLSSQYLQRGGFVARRASAREVTPWRLKTQLRWALPSEWLTGFSVKYRMDWIQTEVGRNTKRKHSRPSLIRTVHQSPQNPQIFFTFMNNDFNTNTKTSKN